MKTFEVAHIREQNDDLIITVVDPSFSHESNSHQEAAIQALQVCASSAGLAGTVVAVWVDASGGLGYYGPTRLRSHLSRLDPLTLAANINGTLTCSF